MSLLREYWQFLKERKKRWIFPLVLALMMSGGLLLLAQGAANSPFLYTFF